MSKDTMYYECHITIDGPPATVREVMELHLPKWKFSAIDGDILLGDGIKCYATRHYNSRLTTQNVRALLFDAAALLEGVGIKVTRRKVELVVFDDRSSKVGSCNGGCVECHLDDLREAS